MPSRWLLVAAVLLAACSGDDDDAATTTTDVEATTAETDVETSDTTAAPPTSAAATTAAGTGPATTATVAPTTLAPSVIPGATSSDPTCRAAGDFFSSLNALIYPLSTSFLDDPQAAHDFATLEVIAAPSLLASGAALEASWPAAAGDELAAVKSGFLDPFATRQQGAVAALSAAGIEPPDQEGLQRAWQALVTTGGTSTEVSNLEPQDLGLGADLAAQLDQASTAFLAAQGPILESGVFGNQVTYPQLEQYLLGACPDVAELVASNI